MASEAGLNLSLALLDGYHEIVERDTHTLTLATMEKITKVDLTDAELFGYPLFTGPVVTAKIRMGINELL